MSETKAPAQDPAPAGWEARSSIARNALHLVLGQVSTTALAIVFSAALGRFLGARDFGLYFLIASFSTFAYVLVDWGQQYFVIREVARTPERGGRLIGTALVMRTVGACLILLPAGLVALALGYDARTCWFAVGYILASLPFFLAQSYGLVFRGRDRMNLEASVSVVNRAAGLALAVGALALGTGLTGVVVSQLMSGLLALALATRLFRRVSVGPLSFSKQTVREVLAGSSALGMMMLAVSVQPYLDAIVLSKLVPADAMGWYGAAKNIMGTLVAPAMILSTAAFPRLSRTAADPAAFKSEVRNVLRPILWFGALAGVGTYIFSDAAIGLIYGHRHFGPASTILKVFGPGFFLLFIDILFGIALTAMGRSKQFSIAKIVSVVLSTALDLVLIPFFQRRTGNGGIGVVTAFLASEFVVFGGALFLMPRGSLGPAALADVARAIGAAAVTGLLFYLIPPLPLAVGLPVCVISFLICTVALRLVRRADLETLKELLHRERSSPLQLPRTPEVSGGSSPAGVPTLPT